MGFLRRTRMSALTVLLAAIGSLAAGDASRAATFVVATDGNDSHPGTKEQPLATLEAARASWRTS